MDELNIGGESLRSIILIKYSNLIDFEGFP